MSGPTRSDLERRIENLETDEGASGGPSTTPITPDDESPLERMYPDEELRNFVHQVAMDPLRITYDTDIANLPDRERVAAVIEEMREKYDLEEDRDEEVVDTLVTIMKRENLTFATDILLVALTQIPDRFDEETREEFDRLFENGERDAAASMMVQALYDLLASVASTVD